MSVAALANLNLMYERGTFTTTEYAQALRGLHNSSTDLDFRSLVRHRLKSVLRMS